MIAIDRSIEGTIDRQIHSYSQTLVVCSRLASSYLGSPRQCLLERTNLVEASKCASKRSHKHPEVTWFFEHVSVNFNRGFKVEVKEIAVYKITAIF